MTPTTPSNHESGVKGVEQLPEADQVPAGPNRRLPRELPRPRRVFIDAGSSETDDDGKSMRWLTSNYPTRKRDFEKYRINTRTKQESKVHEAKMGMSEWLRENLKEEEYGVMKTDAEETVKRQAIPQTWYVSY